VNTLPKNNSTTALIEDAPSAVPPEDLRELHLQNITS